VVGRALDAGVQRIVVPGFAPALWDRVIAVRDRYPIARAALGLHPWALRSMPRAVVHAGLDALGDRILAAGAIAVGECGLDKPAAEVGAPLEWQEQVLRAQLAVAAALALPVILHCVKAHGRLLAILESLDAPIPGVLHSYSGPAELVPRYAAAGMWFSFAPALARPRASRGPLAARAVPPDRLLAETDSPDQSFARGARGEPADLPRVIAALAAIRGAPVRGGAGLLK